MLTRYAQRGAVDRHERKQRLATRQGELSFKVFEVKSMIFHYKLSHECHSERSEESRINLLTLPDKPRPEMFRFAQHYIAIFEMSSNESSAAE